jgi:hypothetical protein
MDQDVIGKMRARVDQCRFLAKHTTDERTAIVLLQMADEGEADVRRLEAQSDASGTDGAASS